MKGRSTGITLCAAYLTVVGLAFLMLTILQIRSLSGLVESLSEPGSEFLLPLFFLTNIISPIVMIAGGVGIWNKKLWGWYAATLVLGAEIATSLIFLVKIPLGMFPVFISSKSIGLLTGLLVVFYLTTKTVMEKFDFKYSERGTTLKRILGASIAIGFIVVFLSPSLSGQVDIQQSSNKSPQPTQKPRY